MGYEVGQKMIFEYPLVTRESWRKQVAEATPLRARLSGDEAIQLTARWAEHWKPAMSVGWAMLEVPGVKRRSLYLRRDHGDGWSNLTEYQEAANRLGTAIRNFARSQREARIVATEWDDAINSHWSRVAFPAAKYWQSFEGLEDDGGSMWIADIGRIEDLHAAVDLALLGVARFAVMNHDFSKAIVPYEGWIDYLHSFKSNRAVV